MRPLNEAKIDKNWPAWLAYVERRLQGTQTGIGPIDQYLLGLGGLTTLQGETGCLKSTVALQVVHHNLSLGSPAIILDRENGENRIKNRMICQANKVSENDIKVASTPEKKALVAAIRHLPLYIYTDVTKETEEIKTRVGDCLTAHPEQPALLLIDSIQAMPPLDSDRAMNIEKWMNFFDQLKLDFEGKLTILVTSEINRASYGLDGGLGAGKGSNAIEFKSETLLDLRSGAGPNEIKCLVAKHRDGQKGATFILEKQFADPNNGASFTFRVDAQTGVLDV